MQKKNLVPFAVIAALVSASSVQAAESPEPAPSLEQLYQIACVPGAESSVPESKRQEALEFRDSFQRFLGNPEGFLSERQLDLSLGGQRALEAALQATLTCEAAAQLSPFIQKSGCTDEFGVQYRVEAATKVCGELFGGGNADERDAGNGQKN